MYTIEHALEDLYKQNGTHPTPAGYTALLAELAELRRKAALYDTLAAKAPAIAQLVERTEGEA